MLRLGSACAAGVVLCGDVPTHGQSGPASTRARTAYARAIEKVEALRNLDWLLQEQVDARMKLAAGVEELASAIQSSRRQVEAAVEQVRMASECAAAVSRDVEESTRLAEEYQRAARESLLRTAEFSRAANGGAAPLLTASEAALTLRAERKEALLRRVTDVQPAQRSCSQRVLDTKSAVESAERSFELVTREARDLDSAIESLQRLSVLLTERAGEAKARGWLRIEVAPLSFPLRPATTALMDRVDALGGIAGLAVADPHASVAADLTAYQDAVLRATVEEDAQQFLTALARNAAATCGADECLRLLGDVEVQSYAVREARTTVEAERARVRQSVERSPRLGVFAAPTSQWTEAQGAIEGAFASARTEVSAIAGVAERLSGALERPIEEALERAVEERRAAYRRVFGVPEPVPPPPPPPPPPPAEAGLPDDRTAARPGRGIRQHAFEVLALRSRESAEYGAYTYVIFPGRDDRPEYQALLHAIVSLTPAADPDAPVEVKNATNLFEIPGKTAAPVPPDAAPDYASRIENYDRARALSIVQTAIAGVLTAPKVLRQFQRSPGPFLLTVPVPLDRARGTTQLLLADLSGYPPAGFQDLVKSYQNDLIDAFPTNQTLWRPPWNQRLALGLMNIGVAITGQNFVALRR